MASQLKATSACAALACPRKTSQHGTSRDLKATSHSISNTLARRIGAHKFDMWFAHTDLMLDGDRLEITTASPFVAKWIDAHFAGEIREAAQQALGRSVALDVRVAANQAGNGNGHLNGAPHNGGANGSPAPGEIECRRPRRSAARAPRDEPRDAAAVAPAPAHLRHHRRQAMRRLDDFVVGVCNKLAYATACRIADDVDAKCISPLFIHGECGVGKTHLLQGVCQRHIDRTGRHQHVRYVTGEQFTNEYIAAIRSNAIDAFRQRIRKLDLLAIDDVHFLSNKVRTQGEFLYTIDAIDLGGARVVMASDNHPHHIKKFSQALVSRFLSGMVVKVDRPDRPTRIELIHRLASQRGVRINEAAVEAIAANCLGSVREIEGALTKLAAYRALLSPHPPHHGHNGNGVHGQDGHAPNGHNGHTSSESAEIGLMLVEQVLKDHAPGPNHLVKMPTVIEVVCARMGVTKADLIGSGRHRRIVLARALVAYLGREMTTRSFPEIAAALGRANHSTIHTADHRLRKQLSANEAVDVGGEAPMSLKELTDQLRRDVLSAGAGRLVA